MKNGRQFVKSTTGDFGELNKLQAMVFDVRVITHVCKLHWTESLHRVQNIR